MAAKEGSNEGRTWADQLRQAIDGCGQSRYAICKECGVEQSLLSRFMAGDGINLATAEKIGRVVGVQLVSLDT